MRRAAFLEQLAGYGVRPNDHHDWRNRPLRAESGGTGRERDYTDGDVRLVVAWRRVLEVTGRTLSRDRTRMDLVFDAACELAEHDDGWVVITEGTVNWTRRPTARVFDTGAVCIPVPEWRTA